MTDSAPPSYTPLATKEEKSLALLEMGGKVVLNIGVGKEATIAIVRGRSGAFFVLEYDDGTGTALHEHPLVELTQKVVGKIETIHPVAPAATPATSAKAPSVPEGPPSTADILTALTRLNMPREVRIDWQDGKPAFWARTIGRTGANLVIAFDDHGTTRTAEYPLKDLRAHVTAIRSIPIDSAIIVPKHAVAAESSTASNQATPVPHPTTVHDSLAQARATGIVSLQADGLTLHFTPDGITLTGDAGSTWEYHITNDGDERMVGMRPRTITLERVRDLLAHIAQGRTQVEGQKTWHAEWK